MTFAQRFIGAETLPSRMSELDVQQFFSLSKDDISAVCERFRDDRRVAAAIQLLFLRASGRPMDRFATVPKVLLRSVCEALGWPSVSIASLRSLYERRQTLYEHQAWARTYLGLGDLDEVQLQKIEQVLAVAALEAAHPDDLVRTASIWLYGRRIIIPGSRRIADWARKAFDATEAAMAATIEAAIGKAALRQVIDWAYAPSPATSGSHLEWLKTPPQRHAPSTTVETLEKIRALKTLGVHNWALDSIALSKQQAYAAHVLMRRPSMTARIEQRRQTVEVVCFLHATLMELTDIALLQASRRSQELFRHAAERVRRSRARSNGATLHQAVRARVVLHDETKSWRDRVLEARTLLDEISDAGATSFASQVRRALAEDSRPVHAHLAGLRDIDFAGRPGDLAYEQWQAWVKLQAIGGREIPPDFKLPSVGLAWSAIVTDLDPRSRYRAFEASTMMALRKSLRRGSVWVEHSICHRSSQSMLLADAEWSRFKEQHYQILGLPPQASEFLAPILATMSVGVYALAEAVERGKVNIDAKGLVHLQAINALDEEIEPRKTREAVFKHIGHVQLPDLLMEIERGWDDLVRLAASIRAGKVSAVHAIHRLGSAAIGDPLHSAADHLGGLLRTLFLCDYLTITDFRREILTLLSRGESVHQLQRAIHGGQIAQDRGRRRQEMVAISGAHALLTNIVLAWNTRRMDGVVSRLRASGLPMEDDWLHRIGPAHFSHINFDGTYRFNLEKYGHLLVERRSGKAAL